MKKFCAIFVAALLAITLGSCINSKAERDASNQPYNVELI